MGKLYLKSITPPKAEPDSVPTFPQNREYARFDFGTMPSKTDPDLSREPSVLGTKDKYTVNELKLMGPGDIFVLYTDGLQDHENNGVNYFPERFESRIRENKGKSARQILEVVTRDLLDFGPPADDVSCILIKKNS